MNKSLFSDFESISSKAWKQKIQADLKGADYNDTLLWHSNEGINVKPFYHADDVSPFSEAIRTEATNWKICETIYAINAEIANAHALEVLNKGTESLLFIIPDKTISVERLLQNINIEKIPLHFELQFLSKEYVAKLNDIASLSNGSIYVHSDIIGNLARSGNWFSNLKEDIISLQSIVKSSSSLKSSLSIDVSLYQNAGANIVQQLTYAMAHVNEYLNSIGENINTQVTFNLAIGANYFFEIAKIRALRLLWQTIASEYTDTVIDCQINAIPSKRNKTLYDYNTNMLRSTTECMSAILGGANSITNLPYDSIYHKNNEFGDRIARNQLLVLKNESYFNKVNNPTDGAFYIENLTNQFAEKALSLFKDIESNGGFLKQLKEGIIQRKIKESANIEQTQFDEGKIVLLGTNKHPNESDKMSKELELYPFVKTNIRKTLIEPIIEKRLSEKTEKERLKQE